MLVLKGNSVLMIWYSIQSPKYLNSKFKFNHKHMDWFLFNIIKEWVYDHRFIFLECALVAITIRIISEPIFVHLLLENWLEVIKCPCRSLFYLGLITLLKLRMWFFILFIKLHNCASPVVIKEIKCGFDRKSGPAAYVASARIYSPLKLLNALGDEVLNAGATIPFCHSTQSENVQLNVCDNIKPLDKWSLLKGRELTHWESLFCSQNTALGDPLPSPYFPWILLPLPFSFPFLTRLTHLQILFSLKFSGNS